MNHSRRKFLAAGAASLSAAGLGFSAPLYAAAQSSSAGEAPLPLSVALLRNLPGALIIVSDQAQIFQRNGVSLTIPGKFLSGGGPELLPAVAAGSADLGVIGDSPVILALGRDALPLKVVSVVSDTSKVFSIMAGPRIASMADLAGKKIGLPLGTAFEYFLARALDKFGLKLGDVKLVNLTQAQALPAFVANRIDAVLPDTFGRSALERARPDARVLFSSEDGFASGPGSTIPFRQYNVFIANNKARNEKREPTRRFLRAYYQDATPLLTNPAVRPRTVTRMTNFLNGAVKSAIAEADVLKQVKLSVFPSTERARQLQQGELLAALDAQAEFWLKTKRIRTKPNFEEMIDRNLLH